MVNGIYSDFIRIVSKERKIETMVIKEKIGSLIYGKVAKKTIEVKSLEHAQRFISQGIETHIIDLPGKDPNELGKSVVKKLIEKSKPVSFGKLMEYKLYAK